MPAIQLSPGLNLHYLDENPSGVQPVLLLHGLGATGESWAMQIPALVEAGYRVIAPDARGFGRSTYPGCTSVAAMAEDMAGLLAALGVDAAHVVGISMGGTIALQLALDYGARVQRLALANTFARLRPDGPGGWFYFGLRLVLVHTLGLETQARAVVKRVFPQPEHEQLRAGLRAQIAQADPRGYRAAMRALARFNVEARLNEIRAPTLVITGENDTTVDPNYQRVLAARIPGAQHVVIPAAGHGVIGDQPEAFNRVLFDFLGVTA
ncbi:MAG: alpha/beta fold hydrolase [Anaerolineales bacterium]